MDVRPTCGEQSRYFTWGTSQAKSTTAVSVFQNATTNANALYKEAVYASFQAIVSGTGAVSATVIIEASNEDLSGQSVNNNWVQLGTIGLSGTTSDSDGFATASAWRYVRARVTAISGTSATVQVIMGV